MSCLNAICKHAICQPDCAAVRQQLDEQIKWRCDGPQLWSLCGQHWSALQKVNNAWKHESCSWHMEMSRERVRALRCQISLSDDLLANAPLARLLYQSHPTNWRMWNNRLSKNEQLYKRPQVGGRTAIATSVTIMVLVYVRRAKLPKNRYNKKM